MEITRNHNFAVILLSPPTNSIHDVIGLTRVWFFQLASQRRVARPHWLQNNFCCR